MRTILNNILFIIIAILVSIAVFNYAQASGRVFGDDDIIGYNKETGDAVRFGEFYDLTEENEPELVDYCWKKAEAAMALLNDRDLLSVDEIMELTEHVKDVHEHYMYVDFVRMIRDGTRKTKKGAWVVPNDTEEDILKFSNGELHSCILQRY